MGSGKLIIGLTGGIGSGKSTAATFFQQLGVTIIDADIAAREVVASGEPALEKLVTHFGTDILQSTSSAKAILDRQKLSSIIFSAPKERQWLNNLLHPLILDWMDQKVIQARSSYVIKVIPLLIETEAAQQVNRILAIDVPLDTQIERISKRDSHTRQEINNIIKSQSSRKDRLALSHDIINNNSTPEDLEIAVKKMHNKYLKIADTF